MPTGMQFNQPTQPQAYRNWQATPQGGTGAGFDWGQLAGLSRYDAGARLLGAGINPGTYTFPNQSQGTGPDSSYWNAGPGKQVASPGFSQPGLNSPWLGGGGGPQLPPSSQQRFGGGSTGFNLGAQGTPFNRTPFYLEPGQNGAPAGPSVVTPGRVPPIVPGQIPTEMNQMQLGGGASYGGLTPEQAQQAAATGQGGMYAGASPTVGRPWETGEGQGTTREQQGFNFLMAQGMPEAQARQQTGWTGAGMTASASQSRQGVNAFNAANSARLTAARPAYDAARARENPASAVSHSGGALLPQLGGGIGQAGSGQYAPPPAPRQTPYTGIAGGQGNSINTYGTPGAGARLGSSGYRY